MRQNWSEHRVFFLDGEGVQHSLPVGWTDAAEADAFVSLAAGRCPFRVSDLLLLGEMVDRLRGGDTGLV